MFLLTNHTDQTQQDFKRESPILEALILSEYLDHLL